jgi:MFS family permease
MSVAEPIPTANAASPNTGRSVTVVCVAALAMVATLPGRTHGLGLVTESLLADFRLDRIAFGEINLWATLLGALFCFPAGRLIDRRGLRPVLVGTALLLGATVVAMSLLHGVAALAILITLTRGFGQSALSVTSIALVGKSFDRRLAWSMTAFSILLTVGFIVAFMAVGASVERFGWRVTWAGVGVSLVVILAPAALLLPRRRSIGYDVEETTTVAECDDAGLELAAALRTPAFWIFAGATSLFGLASSGLGLFNQAVLAERGFDYETYYNMLGLSTLFGLIGQGACGVAARRCSYSRLTTVALALYAAALFWLTRVYDRGELAACAALLGLSGGMITVIFFAVWAQAFGPRHLGRIQGAAQMFTVLASAVGPLLFASWQARTGSYNGVLTGLAAIVTLVAVAAWFVSQPQQAEALR